VAQTALVWQIKLFIPQFFLAKMRNLWIIESLFSECCHLEITSLFFVLQITPQPAWWDYF